MSSENGYNIAIAGATGAVGGAMLETLARRNFPIKELRLLASERSVGKQLEYKGISKITVSAVDAGILQLTDFKTPNPLSFFYGQKHLQLKLE